MYKYLGVYIILTCISFILIARNERLDTDEKAYAIFASIWFNGIFMLGIYLIFS